MDDIDNALAKPATSAELSAAIAKAEAEHTRLDAESAAARTEALDPLASAAQAAKCRARSEDLRFEADRMAAKLDLLRTRHTNAVANEKATAERAEREAAIAERDALALELTEFYPPMVERFVDLMRRIAANNLRVQKAPGGWIDPVEAHARGIPANFPAGTGVSILHSARLPSFHRDPFSYAWPQRERTAVPLMSVGQATPGGTDGDGASVAWIGDRRETA